MISTKGRYALRVMIDLASAPDGRYTALKDISEREDVSFKYLEQIIALMNRAGLLESQRGTNGGYRLKRPASQITAGDVIRAAEGTLAPIACLQEDAQPCGRGSTCSTIGFWEGYYRVLTEYMDGTTLAQLAGDAADRKANKEKAEK